MPFHGTRRNFLHFSSRMELEITVTVAHSFFGLVSSPSEEEGHASFNEETAFALSSVQDIPFSTIIKITIIKNWIIG